MKKHLRFLFVVTLLFATMNVSAQTNFTSKITNPSFENDWTGWTHKQMGLQGNEVFKLKAGKTYCEKWTGRGGTVGDAIVSQTITGLTPGQYELTVAAQNIQEDTPDVTQTGAWIFVDNKKTQVNVANTYKVAFTFIRGEIKIGFEAVGATGNYLCVDNFQLKRVGMELSAELATAISEAKTLYGDGSGVNASALNAAIAAAEAVAGNTSATGQQQADAIVALYDAMDNYNLANASAENPYNMTGKIKNPSFEDGDLGGWTASGMGLQGNTAFSIKQGTYYAEKWTGAGNAVGDGSVLQVLNDMKPGRYILRAAAQNIQENSSSKAQTGAWIVANSHQETVTTRKQYALEFVLVSDQLKLGFKAEGATGNWIAVDNFRLEYISDNFDDIKKEYRELIVRAQGLASQRINSNAFENLYSALVAASSLVDQDNTNGWPAAARQLEATIATADASQKCFAKLADAISAAQTELENSTASIKENYQNAIDEAFAILIDGTTTDAQALAAVEELAKAQFAFRIENGSGTPPKVTTDKRFIKGSKWAFGRSTVSGSNIIERGFCWSENPDPKVTDNRTTDYINQAGQIYWLKDLKPGTMYYMRAYAINKTYAVGYGDVIKFATVPKSSIGHWYNNGGDEEINDRINYAINTSMDYYWANASSIHGFGISVSYSPGTQTADCSYGGSMRVGPNPSYQQPGTIMHEALHGIGVGTYGVWWDEDMHSGDWLGDRANAALQFWDNDNSKKLAGDSMHLWPYGCNGAQEDSHNDNLYCMMGILAQALNEDGLPGSGAIGYALPYYSFTHDDGVKYYIKSEDERYGQKTSYLVETATHKLQWKAMSADEAMADDHAAWYLSFTPSNQYYQLKNAATGYNMTYSSGFKTVKKSSLSSSEDFHLMRGRVDVKLENNTFRGYYIIHPESSSNPPTLTGSTSGNVTSTGFDLHRSATQQRWLIMTGEEVQAIDRASIQIAKDELEKMLQQMRALYATPHTEDVAGTDATFTTQIDAIETAGNATNSVSELSNLVEQARTEGMTFLTGVSATNIDQPFDITFVLQNPDFDTDATTGWTYKTDAPGYGNQAAEYFNKTFYFYQRLLKLPAGVYKFCVNAFQRPGVYSSVLAPYNAGTSEVTTILYFGGASAPVKHICDDRQSKSVATGNVKLSDNTYIPGNMASGAAFFKKGLYQNEVVAELTKVTDLNAGIRCQKVDTDYWTMFDSFRLYFYGQNHAVVAIDDIVSDELMDESIQNRGIYFDLSGRAVGRDLNQLRPGIYIINGKKILK